MCVNYKEFEEDFEKLCEKYIAEDFNAQTLIDICKKTIDNFSG